MEKQEIQELFNKYATDLAPDFETETMNICDFTKFLEDNSIPMQLPVKVNFADTLLDKFEAEVETEKDYIDERSDLPEGKGIWEGIRLSRVFLKEIVRLSKISA